MSQVVVRLLMVLRHVPVSVGLLRLLLLRNHVLLRVRRLTRLTELKGNRATSLYPGKVQRRRVHRHRQTLRIREEITTRDTMNEVLRLRPNKNREKGLLSKDVLLLLRGLRLLLTSVRHFLKKERK